MSRPSVVAAATLLVVLAATFRSGAAVECYKCNSEFDPRCGDPFDPYSLGTVNCSYQPHPEHLPSDLEPTLCRKIKQIVNGKPRVIRGCGLVRDESADDKACIQRSGTKDVRVFYCSCTGDLCNGSTTPGPLGLLVAAVLGLGAILRRLAVTGTP